MAQGPLRRAAAVGRHQRPLRTRGLPGARRPPPNPRPRSPSLASPAPFFERRRLPQPPLSANRRSPCRGAAQSAGGGGGMTQRVFLPPPPLRGAWRRLSAVARSPLRPVTRDAQVREGLASPAVTWGGRRRCCQAPRVPCGRPAAPPPLLLLRPPAACRWRRAPLPVSRPPTAAVAASASAALDVVRGRAGRRCRRPSPARSRSWATGAWVSAGRRREGERGVAGLPQRRAGRAGLRSALLPAAGGGRGWGGARPGPAASPSPAAAGAEEGGREGRAAPLPAAGSAQPRRAGGPRHGGAAARCGPGAAGPPCP